MTKNWRHYAACTMEDPELFFPVGDSGPALAQAEAAKAVCARCPVRRECLDYAVESGQDHGVFGGHTADERRTLSRDRASRRLRESPDVAELLPRLTPAMTRALRVAARNGNRLSPGKGLSSATIGMLHAAGLAERGTLSPRPRTRRPDHVLTRTGRLAAAVVAAGLVSPNGQLEATAGG
jgi:WhiB family redox-sensing transcriptional regulator